MGLSNSLPNSILQPGVCTSTTRPASPYEGQVIFETDTNSTLSWSGTAWVAVSDDDTLHIDTTNNRLGIGTNSPSSKADIYTDSAAGYLYPLTLSAKNASGTKKDYVKIGFGVEQGAVGIEASGLRVQTLRNGATTDALSFTGATNAQTWNFYTEGSSRMTIDSAGDVGIGVASPAENLDVKGSSSDVSMLIRSGDNSGGSNAGKQIVFGYGGGANYAHNIRTRHNAGGQNGNAIDFYTWNQGTDAVSTYGTKLVLSAGADGVLMPQQPYFMATGASWSSIPTGSGAAAKPPNVTQRNMGSYGYSNTTGYFYPPVDGLYLIGYEVGCYSSGSNAAYWRVSMRYNGTGFHDALSNVNYISTGTHDFIATSHIIYLTVGNYVSVNVDTAYNLTSYGGEKFYGVLIA